MKKMHASKYYPHDLIQCQTCDWGFDGHHHTKKETLDAIRKHVTETGHSAHREYAETTHYNYY